MEDRGGSFVAVRRISHSLDRGNNCNTTSAEVVAGSAAWLGRGLSYSFGMNMLKRILKTRHSTMLN
ncbi:hypothetical protein HanXRQr2_Chr06g0241961 [Helianthus annuus]|uniref:Uncharacterized protein n=1 Tax=Helianthus annuus TaxID=4232 RepID=A0A251UG15_HELAN|nr:hypothetical protein HanXRQr2_Chr06g0241961 [Helianthus annuus]KAJ0559275.1 hypothetical protein HanHA300_Chr06g0198551 [Helianthus annuus]KAJ0572219.1 hypothetical protein HanHA89_Chr06g0213381 [Helianthus annuus]KAJ0736673.1 hypothetical protein HanLR1_Chr06g0198551 [Helianthus annuus]KAJ0739606.1 hypothetical protein HanOQP8_Chr06g0207611 [Helianthus annuus]